MHSIDSVDAKILLSLIRDPRQSVVALAQVLGISRNTVQARLTQLEAKEAFTTYASAINTRALGYPLSAFIHAHVAQKLIATISRELIKIPEVLQAWGLSGAADILIRTVAEDAEDLFRINSVVLAIDGVLRTDTSLVMNELVPYRVAPLLERHR